MANRGTELVLIGGNFRVIALEKDTGEKVWETVLVTGIFKIGEPYVSLVIDSHTVYAHTKNEMFCLDLATGKILWQTKVSSLGRAVASIAIAGTNSGQTEAAQVIARSRESSSGGD